VTATVTDILAPVLARISFSFSPAGTKAACLAADEHGNWQLEAWSFDGLSPRWWPLHLTKAVTPSDQLIPLDDGSVLLCRNRSDAHEITLIERHMDREEAWGDAPLEQVLVMIQSRGLRVLSSPGIGLAVVIITDERDDSTLYRLSTRAPHLERVAELSGLLSGGVWLDDTGTLLAVDRSENSGPAKVIAIDLRDGSCTPMLDVSKTSNDRLLLCHPHSELLLVSTDALGEDRLGWGRLGGPEPVRFPETLHQPGQAAQPLTFDSDGQRVLVHFDEGVRSRLAVYTPATDRLMPLQIPAGRIRGTACWIGEVVRFPFSAPAQPTSVATTRIGRAASWSIAPGHEATSLRLGSEDPASGVYWAQAHIERLKGVTGPIEAIVYGGQNWRTNRHLVLALHGGPLSAWRFEFEPLFQHLAAAGIAVVAPNQRGSTGYGAEHTRAIRGAWGGPDLDDICCVARALVAERRAVGAGGLALLGISYGAFLALLAASCEPDLWSHCVALAPFLSGPRLYHEASPRVRTLLEQLGGCQELHDGLGPRDALRLCDTLRAKLLIVHGDQDNVIPVTQSRALRQRLLELGSREGMDFEYLEIPGCRHVLLTGAESNALIQKIVRFFLPQQVRRRPLRQDTERR
jgi:pimeloyl-ACP methyl ester carboxylesterase